MAVPLVGSGSGTDVQNTLAQVLSANGVSAVSRCYSNCPVPYGKDLSVEYDSSIRGESRFNGISWYSVEIKTRVLNGIDDWEAVVPKTLEICQYMGARTNSSCGFHLHVALPEASERVAVIRNIFNLFYRFEPVIFALIAPSRRTCGYSNPIALNNAKLFQGCKADSSFRRKLLNWDRKMGLNLTHLLQGKKLSSTPRVEFRYHHGTLNTEKAGNWIRFILQMTEHACTRSCQASEQVSNSRKGLEQLLLTCGFKVNSRIYSKVSPELRQTGKYLIRRWKKFNGSVPLKTAEFSLK